MRLAHLAPTFCRVFSRQVLKAFARAELSMCAAQRACCSATRFVQSDCQALNASLLLNTVNQLPPAACSRGNIV